MSLDRRLREDLKLEAARIEPDVARSLRAVELRSKRGRGVGLPVLLASAAVIALIVTVRVAQPGIELGPGGVASPTPLPASPSPAGRFAQIAGTYTVTLEEAISGVAANGLGGKWTMRLTSDGVIDLTPPSTFIPGQAGMSGFAFSLSADQFRTNLFYTDFCESVGTYTWTLDRDHLTFESFTDSCSIRQALLAAKPWTVVP